jgi:hypothetical protein
MLSQIAYTLKNCRMTHLGYTGIPVEVPKEVREFNMMIRPVKKATLDPPKQLIYGRTSPRPLVVGETSDSGRSAYQSLNNPYYPRYFTTN